MRAITVRQPWAWAITHGGKDIENRTTYLTGDYRGPVAIHAALRVADDCWDDDGAIDQIADITHGRRPGVDDITLGAVVAVANLYAVHYAHAGCCPNRGAQPFGSPWAMPAHWHLCFAMPPRPLTTPVPAKGRLGLWTLPPDVEAAVTAQLAGRPT